MLEKAFKKKIAEKEKGSGIHLPELTDIQRGIQEILEKFREVQNVYNLNQQKRNQRVERLLLKPGIDLKMK